MARDILSEYGPDSPQHQRARATHGGQMPVQDVRDYKHPQGPMGITGNERPGLGGDNYGNCGTQGPEARRPGESGSPGLHGTNRGMGTNRKG